MAWGFFHRILQNLNLKLCRENRAGNVLVKRVEVIEPTWCQRKQDCSMFRDVYRIYLLLFIHLKLSKDQVPPKSHGISWYIISIVSSLKLSFGWHTPVCPIPGQTRLGNTGVAKKTKRQMLFKFWTRTYFDSRFLSSWSPGVIVSQDAADIHLTYIL